jgi:hypothetical protein
MTKAKNTRYKLEIRESSIAGQGLFALEDIPWGKKIKEYAGKIISDKEAAKRAKEGATAIMELGKGKSIDGFDGGNGAAYVNHSRDTPNCFLLRNNLWVLLIVLAPLLLQPAATWTIRVPTRAVSVEALITLGCIQRPSRPAFCLVFAD